VYKVLYLDKVEKDLKRMDKPTCKAILNKIEHTLAKDPQGLGKALTGQFKGFWRYRFGNYRVIYKLSETEILIIVAKIGQRKDVYS